MPDPPCGVTQVLGEDLYQMWTLLQQSVVYFLRANASSTGELEYSVEGVQRAADKMWQYCCLVEDSPLVGTPQWSFTLYLSRCS